jgi:hypothetical protein
MKFKLDRIISIATLVALVVGIFVMARKPSPVAQAPQASTGTAATRAVDPQPSNRETAQPERTATQAYSWPGSGGNSAVSSTSSQLPSQPVQNSPAQSPRAGAPNINSEGVSAAISQLLSATAGGGSALSPDSEVGSGTPNIKDQKVTYDGDTVHGQFLTEIGGKDVWVTISGHMGQKDGYATFDPTEFKVGNMDVPVALVNPALQRKLAEERDRLKLSDGK